MLASATTEFARLSDAQSILARGADAFVAHATLADADPYPLNWHSPEAFVDGLERSVERRGPVDLCLLWIHADAEPVIAPLIELLAGDRCRLIHVLGSATSDPRPRAQALRERIAQKTHLDYHTVALGSILVGRSRRWLTNDEICAGVIECERLSRDVIVGELSW